MRTVDPHKTTTDVRQADRKRGTLWVLIVSVIIIFLVFAGMWWWYTLGTPHTAG
jgi:flagellar basal body-associated protein FliL